MHSDTAAQDVPGVHDANLKEVTLERIPVTSLECYVSKFRWYNSCAKELKAYNTVGSSGKIRQMCHLRVVALSSSNEQDSEQIPGYQVPPTCSIYA